nr:alpha/beta hydrolase [Pseudomonadota bacterium]
VLGTFMAATLPERIEKIIMIDVTPFLKVYTNDIITASRKYYQAAKLNRSIHTLYKSREAAARKRIAINPIFTMKLASALALTEGGMIEVSGGFKWTFDLKLLFPNFMTLSSDAIASAMQNIIAKVCIIVATNGLVKRFPDYQQQLASIKQLELHELPGSHHIHLDEPEIVATVVKHFLD